MKPKVQFEHVSKKYKLYNKSSDKLFDLFSINKKAREFKALSNLSFEVLEGETIGVVGINGSGKSTVSNLLAQVIPPTSGELKINGVVSLIAISAGLNNNLTGMENIKLKCLMLGLSKSEIDDIIPEIVDFADIGTFINQPVKNYSSGMRSRLGFAISVHTNPDVLVIDEALSVGDQTFYNKCLNKFNEFKAEGKTIFFISHSISQVRSIADKVLWLNSGKIVEFGKANIVLNKYKAFIEEFSNLPEDEKKKVRESELQERLNGITASPATGTDMELSVRNSKSSRKLENRKIRLKKLAVYSQVAFFFLCFILSAMAMFFDFPSRFSAKTLESQNEKVLEEKTINKEVEIKDIQQNGVIVVATSSLFQDQKLTTSNGELEFSTPINVEKQIGDDIYQIRYNDQSLFVRNEDVKLGGVDETNKNSFSDLLSFFPNEFTNSFQFYLAFLSRPGQEIKENLNGLTSEDTNEAGNTILNYKYDKLSYQMNNEGISSEIIVKDINIDSESLTLLLDKATLSSIDQNLHLLTTENYVLLFNQLEKTVSIKNR